MTKICRQYLICQVRPDMILAKPVMKPARNIILLTENTVLTQRMIDMLMSSGCHAVDILEDVSTDDTVFFEDAAKFQKTYSLMLSSLNNAFEKIRNSQSIPVPQLEELTLQSLDIICYREVLKLLNTIKIDNYTLKHSINVALVAGSLAQWLGLPKQVVSEVIVAGMLHDIGKMMIPDKILNKPGKLLAYEMSVVRCHPFHSFQLVQPSLIPEEIKYAILQHHERLDGSGYPEGLSGDAVSPLAQIIAIADIYDAMTSPHVYREALSPLQAIQEFLLAMFGKLNPQMCFVLADKIKDLLIGHLIVLNDGQTGKIVQFSHNQSCRPLIQLYDGQYIDLEKYPEMQVEKVVGF
jgi:putative nucleotidyltransferase with HDIG domain